MEKFVLDKKGLLVSSVGNMLMWYDFSLFMPLLFIFSKIFFPIEDVGMRSVVSFLAMSSALVARPVGSAIFGPISDKIGRRRVVEISIFVMAVSTFCIGLLPDYQQIGILAPILLVFFRILQGISMGGGYGAAIVHLVEIAPRKRRGFFGSLAEGGSQIGIFFAESTLLVMFFLFAEDRVYQLAWRIPFFLSALLIPFAFFSGDDSKPQSGAAEETSFFKMLLNYKKEVLCTMGITSFSSIGFYALFTFFPYYFLREGAMTLTQSTECTVIAAIFVIISIFSAGYLSDYFSRKLFLKIGMAGVCVATALIFNGLKESSMRFLMYLIIYYTTQEYFIKKQSFKQNTIFLVIIFFGLLAIRNCFEGHSACSWYFPTLYAIYGTFLGLYFGSRPAFFAETFKKEVRCTGVSASLAFAHAVIGGLANIILDFCTKISNFCAVLPIIVVTVIALIAMSQLEDRTGKKLV